MATDTNPTSEFEERCLSVRWRWERGELAFRDALAELTTLEQEAMAAGHPANQGVVERVMGLIQLGRGNLNTALRHCEQAWALFTKAGSQRYAVAMDLNLGEVYRYKGDFNRARQLFRTAYESAKAIHFLTIQTFALANEGQLLLSMGQHAAARAPLQEAYQLSQQWTDDRNHLPGLLCEVHHALAVIYLAQGETESAWEQAKQALEMAQNEGQAMLLGFANRAIAEVLTALGESPDDGFSSDPDPYYQTAIEKFRETNAEVEMARTMYAQAHSLAKQGKRTTAARKFQQVLILFTKLGMVDDAARAAEAQLKVL